MPLSRRETLRALGALAAAGTVLPRTAAGQGTERKEAGDVAGEAGRIKKVLAVNGSPRGRHSNTRRILSPLLEGAREEGVQVEEVYLADLTIGPCRGCFGCWTQTPGKCVQEDDMAALMEKVLNCDALVLGFGLYIRSVPSGVQAMMERMLPMAEPWLVEGGDGATTHPARHRGRRARWIVISNCGFPEESEFRGLRTRFGQQGVDPITMPAGEFLGFLENAPLMAEALGAFRSALRDAGRQLVQTGDITGEVRAKINRPVIDWAGVTAQQYRDSANAAFRQALDQSGAPAEPPAP
jgi:multimeric flavodoxin WrbA